MKRKIHYRCQTCGSKNCNHDFVLKTIQDEEGFWVAQGPYNKEDAERTLSMTVELLEKRQSENKA